MENNESKRICRLCLQIMNNYNEFNYTTSYLTMLEECLPEINLNISNSTISCKTCKNWLEKLHTFKLKCIQNDENLRMKHRLNGNTSTDLNETCRSCLNKTNEYSSISLDDPSSDCILINMLTTCVPEMDLNLYKNSIMCNICGDLLKQFYLFKSECLYTEDKIISYAEENEKETIDLIDLINLQNEIINENNSEFKINIDYVKIEEDDDEVIETDSVNSRRVKKENITGNDKNLIWYTCDICPYKSKWKNHVKRHKQVHDVKTDKKFRCLKCNYTSKYKHSLLHHSTIEHGTWLICKDCDYRTKFKRSFNEHLLTHQNGPIWYKCDTCFYKSKWKHHIKRHMTTHE